MKSLNLILLSFFFSSLCLSQQIIDRSDNIKPKWFSGNSNIESTYFQYFVSQGTSVSIDTARKNAVQNVILEYAQSLGTEYIVGSESSTDIFNISKDDSVKTTTSFIFSGKIKGKEQNFKIPCFTIVEYYWERELYNGKPQYQYWILVRIPNKERDCNLPFYKSYGKSAIWRSAILPGWGQMHLGYNTKGTILLTSTAILLSGIATSQIMYINNWNNYTNSLNLGNTEDAQVYKSNADDWFLVRNINLIALGSVYVFNLVDAITRKGVNVYANNDSKVKVYPSLCLNSAMVTLKIKI
jgi:hypothetical protein